MASSAEFLSWVYLLANFFAHFFSHSSSFSKCFQCILPHPCCGSPNQNRWIPSSGSTLNVLSPDCIVSQTFCNSWITRSAAPFSNGCYESLENSPTGSRSIYQSELSWSQCLCGRSGKYLTNSPLRSASLFFVCVCFFSSLVLLLLSWLFN